MGVPVPFRVPGGVLPVPQEEGAPVGRHHRPGPGQGQIPGNLDLLVPAGLDPEPQPGLPDVPDEGGGEGHPLQRRAEDAEGRQVRDPGSHLGPGPGVDLPVRPRVQDGDVRPGPRQVQCRLGTGKPPGHPLGEAVRQGGRRVLLEEAEAVQRLPPELEAQTRVHTRAVEAGRHPVLEGVAQGLEHPHDRPQEPRKPGAGHLPHALGLQQDAALDRALSPDVPLEDQRRIARGLVHPEEGRIPLARIAGQPDDLVLQPGPEPGPVADPGGEGPIRLPAQVQAQELVPLRPQEVLDPGVRHRLGRPQQVPVGPEADPGGEGAQGLEGEVPRQLHRLPGGPGRRDEDVLGRGDDPLEAEDVVVPPEVGRPHPETLRGPAYPAVQDRLLQPRGENGPEEGLGEVRDGIELPGLKPTGIIETGIHAPALHPARDGGVPDLVGGDVGLQPVQDRPHHGVRRGRDLAEAQGDPGPSAADLPQVLDPVGLDVGVGQEGGIHRAPVQADLEGEGDAPFRRRQSVQAGQDVDPDPLVRLVGGRLPELTEGPGTVREGEVPHEDVAGGDPGLHAPGQSGIPVTGVQPQLVHPDLTVEGKVPPVPDPEGHLPDVGQVRRPPPFPEDHGVGGVGRPLDHRRVPGTGRVQDEGLLGPGPQIQELVEVHQDLRKPVRRLHAAGGRGPEGGAVEIEILGVCPDLEEEAHGDVGAPVPGAGDDPEARLTVGQEIPGALGEAGEDLAPVPGLQVLHTNAQGALVELQPLPAHGPGGIRQLLQDPGRRLVGVPLREAGDGPHLGPPREGRRVPDDPGEDALGGPADPAGPDDPHPGQGEVRSLVRHHGEPQLPHRPEVGLRHGPVDLGAGAPDGDPVEPELRPGLAAAPGQEGRGAVQGDHVPQRPLRGIQVAVPVQVLGVVPAVGAGAVGPGIPQPPDPPRLPGAVLAPQPHGVQGVPPDLSPGRIRFLVQGADPPGHRVLFHPRGVAALVHEEGVLADRPQIQDEAGVATPGHVELQELAPGQVGAGGAEGGGDGGPPALVQEGEPLQPHPEAGLPDLGPGHPDLLVDLLPGQEALVDPHAVPLGILQDPVVLPGDVGQVPDPELRRKHVLRPGAALRRAPQRPVVGEEGEGPGVAGVEVVQEDGPLGVGGREGHGQLPVHGEGRGLPHPEPRHLPQRPVQPGHRPFDPSREPRQRHGPGLESEDRTGDQRLLRLVQRQEIQLAPGAGAGVGVEGHHRSGGGAEDLLLLPGGPDGGVGGRGEEGLGILQRHEAPVVVDLVVHAPDQETVPQGDALAPLQDPQRPQGEGADHPLAPDRERDRQPEEAAVRPVEGILGGVDPLVGVLPEERPGVVLGQPQRRDRGWFKEGTERREDQEGPGDGGRILEELGPGGVDPGRVHLVQRGFLVQPEELEEGHVPPPRAPLEGAAGAELPQGDGHVHRRGLDVG